jgi:hypothetical protein
MPSVVEADAYIFGSDRYEAWQDYTDEEKQRFLNMASLKLRSAYPCLSEFQDEHIILQASYMITSDYSASASNMSSMSASMTGVSVSWARSKLTLRSDGLDPLVMGLLGDPAVVCPEKGRSGVVKAGRLL